MNEDFLHYLWKFRLLEGELKTTEDERITIIDPGILNRDAGPDFFNARLRIDNTLWAGNIEVHVHASDWVRHGHQYDERYQNIIMHIVYEEDTAIYLENGHLLTTLVIKGLFKEGLFESFRHYMRRKSWIPCEKLLSGGLLHQMRPWIRHLLAERLNEKATAIERTLILNGFDWEQSIYQLLAKSLPVQILARHRHNLFELEALLFGQAGFLGQNFSDEYHRKLKDQYLLFQKRYALFPMEAHLWNFLRLRPANFPTVRIAQFAFLLGQSASLFELVMGTGKLESLEEKLKTGTSVYWHTHFTFDKPSPKSIKKLGASSIHLIIINTIVPFYYVYGMIKDKPAVTRKSMQFLKALPPERNHKIIRWESLDAPIKSAYESQAFLQLKNAWCDKKRCLECRIGDQVLREMK
jgi:hypothetical protein